MLTALLLCVSMRSLLGLGSEVAAAEGLDPTAAESTDDTAAVEDLPHKVSTGKTEEEAIEAEQTEEALSRLEHMDGSLAAMHDELTRFKELLARDVADVRADELKAMLARLPTMNGEVDRLQAQVIPSSRRGAVTRAIVEG